MFDDQLDSDAYKTSKSNQDANTNLKSIVAISAYDILVLDATFELDLSTGSPSYAPVIIYGFTVIEQN